MNYQFSIMFFLNVKTYSSLFCHGFKTVSIFPAWRNVFSSFSSRNGMSSLYETFLAPQWSLIIFLSVFRTVILSRWHPLFFGPRKWSLRFGCILQSSFEEWGCRAHSFRSSLNMLMESCWKARTEGSTKLNRNWLYLYQYHVAAYVLGPSEIKSTYQSEWHSLLNPYDL